MKRQSPPAITGRSHIEIQTDTTDNQLEEITDKPLEADISTQTDDMDDKPLPVFFVPHCEVADKSTSIEHGELFDFEVSVEPLLEVLVGKTLDQALTEVMEEEEIKSLTLQKRHYEQIKGSQRAEVQRLEAESIRAFEEKQRRVKEAKASADREALVAKQHAAHISAREFIVHLEQQTIDHLEHAGYFYDPVIREVEHRFLPWLYDTLLVKLRKENHLHAVVDDVIGKAVSNIVLSLNGKDHLSNIDQKR